MTRLGILSTALILTLLCAHSPLLAQQAANAADKAKKDDPEKTKEKRETQTIKKERLKIEVKLTGKFEADKSWPVVLRPKSWSTFPVIKAVPHGKRVKKGETLVWLDTKAIDEKLDDAKSGLQSAKLGIELAQLERKLSEATSQLDLDSAERANRIAGEDLKYFLEINRPYLEESAKFSLKSSQQSLEYTMEELKQLEKMYGADDLTEETEEIVLKRARNDVERSEHYLKSSQIRTKRSLEKDIPRQEQQQRDAAKRAEIALRRAAASTPITLQKQKLELDQKLVANQRALAAYEKLQHDRKLMNVVAPADGFVYYGQCKRGKWSGVDAVSSQLQVGGKLMSNSVFMTIVSPRPMHVRVEVPEKELHHVRPGIRGSARPNGYPDLDITATLEQLGSFPISSGTFDARAAVELNDAARPIVPGMGCELTFVAYDNKQALTVPATAVFENEKDGRKNRVFRIGAGGKPQAVTVTVGQKTDKKWEITGGLKEGDEILLKKPEK